MAKKTAALLPATAELLRQFGDRLRLARLRRRLSAKQVAERAGMAPMTLRGLERGGAGVTMGAYLAVMQVLGIEKDLDQVGKADSMGRELQDAQLPRRAMATRPVTLAPIRSPLPARKSVPQTQARKMPAMSAVQKRKAVDQAAAPNKRSKPPPKTPEAVSNWIKKSGFTSADALAGLIVPPASSKKAR